MLAEIKRTLWLRMGGVAPERGSRAPAAMPVPGAIRRLTILKPDAIGDFVLATAWLRPLADRVAQMEVALVVGRPVASLARQQFPGWRIAELPARTAPWRYIVAQREIRATLQGLPEAELMIMPRAYRTYGDAALASWTRARCRMSVANAYPRNLSAVVMPREEDVFDVLLPRAEPLPGEARDLADQRTLGAAVLGGDFASAAARPCLLVPAEDAKHVAHLLRDRWRLKLGEPYMVVCPGTSGAIKEYPVRALARAVERGVRRHRELPVIVAGSVADLRTTAPLCRALGAGVRVIDATGGFDLPRHVALLAAARMVLSMDSCHVHIAGALGTPCVCILGGGQFGDFGPWGEGPALRWLTHPVECYGCQWRCIHDRPLCVTDLTEERIAAAMQDMLDRHA